MMSWSPNVVRIVSLKHPLAVCVPYVVTGAVSTFRADVVIDGSASFTHNSAGGNGGEKGRGSCIV